MSFLLFILICHQCLSVNTLFEDQIGILDWSQKLIGHITHAVDSPSYPAQRYFVGSERNVVASLFSSNGSISWRKVLYDGGQFLNLLACDRAVLSLSMERLLVLRSWDPKSGALSWEKYIETNNPSANMWCMKELDTLFLSSDQGIFMYDLNNGKETWSSKDVVWAEPVQELEFKAVAKLAPSEYPHTVVILGRQQPTSSGLMTTIHSLYLPSADVKSFSISQVHAQPLQSSFKSCAIFQASGESHPSLLCLTSASQSNQLNLLPLRVEQTNDWITVNLKQPYSHLQVLDQSRLLLTSSSGYGSVWELSAGDKLVERYSLNNAMFATVVDFNKRQYIFTGFHKVNDPFKNFLVSICDSSSGQPISGLLPISEWTIPKHHGLVRSIHATIFMDHVKGQLTFNLLVQTEDQTIQLLRSDGSVRWRRSEALADIKAVELVDLPVSESQARMEEEFGHTHNNIIEMFVKRFRTQAAQLMNLIQTSLVQLTQLKSVLPQKDPHNSANRENTDTSEHTISIPPRLYTTGMSAENQTLDEFLIRDNFNTHKLIVVATAVGKLFGLESERGRVVWEHLVPSTSLLANQKLLLVQQRNTAHFPLPPIMTLLLRHQETRLPVLFSFNPITGVPLHNSEPNSVSSDIIQAVLFPGPVGEDCDYLRPILLLHHDLKLTIHPSASRIAVTKKDTSAPLYIYAMESDSARLVGYKVEVTDDEALKAQRVWRMELGLSEVLVDEQMEINSSSSSAMAHKIAAIGSRSVSEHIHSVGRVLGDRSVLYKYLNPNLIAVVTVGGDVAAQTNTLMVYLIDVVVGRIVYSAAHRRCTEPVTLVVSENWIVYSYCNHKSLRYEVTVLELFEPTNRIRDGDAELCASFSVPKPVQLFVRNLIPTSLLSSLWPDSSLDSHQATKKTSGTLLGGGSRSIFSSLFRATNEDGICGSTDQISLIPEVLQQSYILTTPPVNGVAAVSMTERGITSKSIIYGLQRGSLIDLPKAFFDPRRSLDMTPELSEEGVHPYTPVLVLPDQAVISYNQSIMGLRAIRTASTGLESTSLVFAYGLDIFFTHIAPSLTYDLLKEDFDYTAIATVTLGMLVASVVTQRLATRRAVHRAWA